MRWQDNLHLEQKYFSKTANLSLRTLLCDLLVFIHLEHHGILHLEHLPGLNPLAYTL